MRHVATITLELLRRGLAHNQLLSPVTDYLALCGDHEGVTVHVPFEHWEFLNRMRGMDYHNRDIDSRVGNLRSVAQDVTRILEQVPGLLTELSSATRYPPGIVAGDRDVLTHLRLVLSASELSLLPFELALGPAGAMGAGHDFLLQTIAPIALTREVRRAAKPTAPWPRRPRILFAAAQPPGVSPIPLRAHALELRHAIDPWVMPSGSTEGEIDPEPMLTSIPNASIEAIRDACSRERFTHVHILAHGARLQDGVHDGYGLALWDRDHRGMEIVSGQQLGAALRTHLDACSPDLSSPAVVTIASCDSANVSSVLTPGGSLAHAIHAAGIPLVVASQFPLTVAGSITMVRVLYGRLLWGDDPRVVLHDLRQQLYQMTANPIATTGSPASRDIYDWASVVAYAAFGTGFLQQLRETRSDRARHAMAVAMARADRHGPYGMSSDRSESTTAELEKDLRDVKDALDCMPEVERDASGSLVRIVSRQVEELGLQGSAEKRRAWGYFLLTRNALSALAAAEADRDEVQMRKATLERDRRAALERAALGLSREHYRRAFEADMSAHWAGVQYLCLCAVTGVEPSNRGYRVVAGDVAIMREDDPDLVQRAWALASLLELKLLDLEPRPESPSQPPPPETTRDFWRYWERFCALLTTDSPEWLSTERQLRRYRDWWTHLPNASDLATRALAAATGQPPPPNAPPGIPAIRFRRS